MDKVLRQISKVSQYTSPLVRNIIFLHHFSNNSLRDQQYSEPYHYSILNYVIPLNNLAFQCNGQLQLEIKIQEYFQESLHLKNE